MKKKTKKPFIFCQSIFHNICQKRFKSISKLLNQFAIVSYVIKKNSKMIKKINY